MKHLARAGWKLGAGLALGLTCAQAGASLSFAAAGVGASGELLAARVDFAFTTHSFSGGVQAEALQITLTNTAAATTVRGDLLTGLFFSLDGNVGSLANTGAGFDGVAARVHDSSSGDRNRNVNISPALAGTDSEGTYQLSNLYAQRDRIANNGVALSAEYGISTVGLGLGGFNGKALNGDDYGIKAGGSLRVGKDGEDEGEHEGEDDGELEVEKGSLKNVGSLIDGVATFWILRPTTFTSLEQINDVHFAFGSQPESFLQADVTLNRSDVTPITAVAEPETALMWGLGLAALAGAVRRRAARRGRLARAQASKG